jgi:Glycosyltransferase family 10 (fucosyltransferase).
MLKPIKRKARRVLNYFRPIMVPDCNNIKLYNWVRPPAPQDLWLAEFINARKLLPISKKAAIFSVFGERRMMRLNCSNYKIFVARENLHRLNWLHYDDLCLKEKWVDLAVGFDYLKHEKYIRFPLWLMWIFKPTDTYEDIKQICEKINNPQNSSYENRKFCAFLSSHDDIGRREIYEELSAIGTVDCDGRLFHNNDELKTKFSDDKLAYLRNYRFNLCPENSDAEGYCTEKIFEAIYSGCMPIYWGSGNNPEPDVLNQNAILFVNIGEKNGETIARIREMNENPKLYQEFVAQPRLMPQAPDVIWEYFCNLEKKIKNII